MSTLHAPASVFPFQTPSRLIGSAFEPSTGCTVTAPNAPDEPLDAETVAEMNGWIDEHDVAPTGDELDELYDQVRVENGTTDGAAADTDAFFASFVDRIAANAAAVGCVALPATLPDDALVGLLDQADRNDPNGYLAGMGVADLPDFAAACAAEIVRRLDGRPSVALAA